MTGGKYKIEQNGQFLGHWCATSPARAIEKMSKSMYADVYKPNFNDYFDVTRGSHTARIYVGEA
jgi:hypothetical protein